MDRGGRLGLGRDRTGGTRKWKEEEGKKEVGRRIACGGAAGGSNRVGGSTGLGRKGERNGRVEGGSRGGLFRFFFFLNFCSARIR